MFPVEIWEQIFKHADPIDLLRFRRVCKSWYEIIPKILEPTDIWYKKCRRDVPSGLWSSILEHHSVVHWQNFHQSKSHPGIWRALCRSWIIWGKLVEQNYTVETFKPTAEHRPLERITCVAALNNTIAVGSSEGYLTFHNITDNLFYKIDHALFIQDVQLWRNGAGHMIATSSSTHGIVNHWNMHDKVLERQSRAKLISSSFQYCYMIMNNILTVDRPGTYRGEKSNVNDSIMLVKDRYELPYFGKVAAICADRQEVMLWTEENYHFQVNVNPNGSGYEEFEVNEPDIPIRCYKIFKPWVTGCIGELGEFGFSIGGREWKIYNLFSKFYAQVTAILFHVALLVLGLETGEIHLFAVKDVDSLESLNFETIQSKKLILDTDAIITLNAMEHDSAYYIVAATDRNVHVVKFNSL